MDGSDRKEEMTNILENDQGAIEDGSRLLRYCKEFGGIFWV
jgi:hypothetical protein